MTVRIFRIAIAAGVDIALLSGCGPSVERAFSNCTETAYKLAIAGSKGLLPKDVAPIFEKAARATAEKRCSVIRDECRNNAQSDMCQRLVQQYGGK